MEDGNAFLLVKNGVGLPIANSVLARGVPRVQHRDSASGLILRLLFDFFHLELVYVLVHLLEAVVFLVNDHVVLKHVLVVSHAHHRHRQLLTSQGCELAGLKRLGCFTAVRKAALLVGRLLK